MCSPQIEGLVQPFHIYNLKALKTFTPRHLRRNHTNLYNLSLHQHFIFTFTKVKTMDKNTKFEHGFLMFAVSSGAASETSRKEAVKKFTALGTE